MPKILIIDDDPSFQKMLVVTLIKAGFEVEAVSNGTDGIQKFKNSPTDLLITDMVLPDMTGIEVVMEIRKIAKDTKIIAISGGGRIPSPEYLGLANKLGAEKVFQKPINREEIITTIKNMLNK